MTDPILAAHEISKRYGGVQALQDVSIELQQGEVHALVGENGAGKTTLERVLAGEEQPDSGQLRLGGDPVRFQSPSEARSHGIAVVHQHFPLVPAMTVAQNLFLRDPPARLRLGPLTLIDHERLVGDATEALRPFGLHHKVQARIRDLTVAERQIVEIAKALSRDARILILDEPTSSLNPSETDRLFEHVRRLREEGAAIVFISHRVEEVMDLSDRVTVLRDGKHIATQRIDQTNADEIVSLIVGRSLDQGFPEPNVERGQKLLEADDIKASRDEGPWNLNVRKGEILGVSGLLGSGVRELVGAVSGAGQHSEGELRLGDDDLSRTNIKGRIRAGLCFVPGDLEEAVADNLTIAENILLPNLDRLSRWGVIRSRRSDQIVEELIERLDIRPADPAALVSNLSGGNKQKVAVAKWLVRQVRLLVMDDPFKGVDVGAKMEVCRVMSDFVEQEQGILFASSDLLELLGMSDRILVMHAGEIVEEFEGSFEREAIMAAALGVAGKGEPRNEDRKQR